MFGCLAIVLSSYILSHAASNLGDEFDISDMLFGVAILFIVTTLPEKFVAAMSGFKDHTGIMVANTVRSNIFLLRLCIGILWVSTGSSFDQESVNAAELCCIELERGHDGDCVVWSEVESLGRGSDAARVHCVSCVGISCHSRSVVIGLNHGQEH